MSLGVTGRDTAALRGNFVEHSRSPAGHSSTFSYRQAKPASQCPMDVMATPLTSREHASRTSGAVGDARRAGDLSRPTRPIRLCGDTHQRLAASRHRGRVWPPRGAVTSGTGAAASRPQSGHILSSLKEHVVEVPRKSTRHQVGAAARRPLHDHRSPIVPPSAKTHGRTENGSGGTNGRVVRIPDSSPSML